jgi:hypothetical protein
VPVGTVRGRYELDAPALRTLKDLERQGIRTNAQMKTLGQTIDKIADRRDVQQIRAVGGAVRSMATETNRELRRTDQAWNRSTRNLERNVRRQEQLIDRLIRKVEELGAARAEAQVDVGGVAQSLALLETFDKRLGQLNRQRATPRVSVGGGIPRGGGGGGGFRGGGGGQGLRSVGFGPLNFGSKGGIALMGAALPAVQSLLGATGALAGSAGAGAIGGGALGIAGGGALAAGIGSIVAVAKPAQKVVSEAAKAQEKYNQALADFGRDSTQARNAKRELDQAFKAAPRGTRDLLRDLEKLRSFWRRETRSGREDWVGLLQGGVRTGRRLAPTAARAGNRSTRALRRESDLFGRFASGRVGRRGLEQGSRMFDENLGNVRQTGQYGIEAGVNVMEASRPFLQDATRFIRNWVRGWATSTRDIDSTRRKVGAMVEHLKSWARLFGATFRVLRTGLGAGAGPGKGLVDDLTGQLNTWDRWMKRNPARVREFFRDTVKSTKELARAVGRIVAALSQLATQLTPVLDRLSQLASLAGSAGLLTPGAAALALGAYRGARGRPAGPGVVGTALGRMRGGGGTAGGGSSAAPVLAGAAAARAGGLRGAWAGRNTRGYMRGTYGLGRSFGYGRMASAGAAAGGALGNLPGAGAVGGAARGAGRAFLPVAAIMGALDFAGFEGGIGGRTQAALSGATLGLINRPKTASQKQDAALGAIDQQISGMGAASNAMGMRRQIEKLEMMKGGDFLIGTDAAGDAKALGFANKILKTEIDERKKLIRDYYRSLRQRRDEKAVDRAATVFGELQEGFGRRSRKMGAAGAMGVTVDQVRSQMRQMRDAGAKELAASSVSWARQIARGNPEMLKQFKELEQDVIKRFGGMARKVAVVNGQILVGTRNEWGAIRSALASAARRGVDETSEEFRRLRAVAIGALRDMGFTASEARALFRGRQAGGERRRVANAVVKAGPGAVPVLPSRGAVSQPNEGGRTGDAWGAEAGASKRNPGGGATSAGGWASYDAEARRFGLTVTSRVRPGAITSSGNVSLHASGDATDYAGNPAAMMSFAQYMAQTRGPGLDELIYSPLGYGIKNGQRVPPYAVADHYDHVHVGDRTPGGPGGGLPMGGMGAPGGMGGMGGVSLRGRRSRLGGVPGAMSTAASAGIARGMEAVINRQLGAGGGGGAMGAGAAGLAQLWRAVNGGLGDARLMGAIAMAESGGNAGAIGIPTSGGRARGLWQIMWPLHQRRFPGMDPLNPRDNAAMAGAILKDQGLGAWEAYTKGMHNRFLGSFRHGGRFVTPKGGGGFMQVGEGIGQEEVTVRPYRQRRRRAGGFGGAGAQVSVSVDLRGSTIREAADVDRLAERVGEKVGERLLSALRNVDDDDLID